jgi:predicted transcriptional regulator
METTQMLPEKIIGEVHTCHDLVQCAFSLAEFEVEVYYQLSQSGPLRADELAAKMGKDRSTVYRSLQKLMTCGMVYRETKSIVRGGYFHVYKAIGKDLLRERLERCVNDWYSHMQEVLSRFGEAPESSS